MTLPHRPALTPVPVKDRFVLWTRGVNRRQLVAFALSIGCATLVFIVVQRARTTIAELGERVEVAVVARPMAAGTAIADADLTRRLWPVGLVPPSAVAVDPVGRVTRVPLVPGEVVIEGRLFSDDSLLLPGQRQITLPLPLAPPPLNTGDRVELVGLLPADGPFASRPAVLAQATVVAHDEFGVSVAVSVDRSLVVVEHLILGVIEIVVLP